MANHVLNYVTQWRTFADEQHLIVLAPTFGSGDFKGYRCLFGRRIDADMFVNHLVDSYGKAFIPVFDGTFYLYGHSAGGQFAARYAVTHPPPFEAHYP